MVTSFGALGGRGRGLMMAAALATASGPVHADPAKKGNPAAADRGRAAALIEIVAKVVRYDIDAAHDHYDDGRTVTYAATVFQILTPARLRTQPLTVYHDRPIAAGNPLRTVGQKVRFRIQESSMSAPGMLFIGALEGVTPQAE